MSFRKRGTPAAAAQVPSAAGAADLRHEVDNIWQQSSTLSHSSAGAANRRSSQAATDKQKGALPAVLIRTPLVVLVIALLTAMSAGGWPSQSFFSWMANHWQMSSSSRNSSDRGGDTPLDQAQPAAVDLSSDGYTPFSGNAASNAGSSAFDHGWVVSDARGFFPRGCKWREVYREVCMLRKCTPYI
jgi:hypothetical protein